MAHYDGSIKFDTSIDSRKFESGVQKLKSTAIKGMAVVGTAFTTAAGYAINLASDLQEVQNVVDVTFGDKAADIETWAKNAAGSFGLSELQAKKFNGTMGAMIKSMGLTDSAVYEMSTTLTGLAADFASFYNLEHQEAFDKIRAGISGETEPLKQLGINMSVANLEAYALSQGITKSYNAMSQAEQATLRYNYLLKAGADAQGDFARTSDSFANQLKIAKLNVTELASEFGDILLPIASQGLKEISSATVELKSALATPELRGAVEEAGGMLITLIDKGIELAIVVIPPLISVLGFLAENLELITAVTLGSVAAFKGYAIITSVQAWLAAATPTLNAYTVAVTANSAAEARGITISALLTSTMSTHEIVVGVLTGKITLATAAQALWNKVKMADPTVLVTTAVIGLTVAIGALLLTQDKELTASQKIAQTNKEVRKSIEDLESSRASAYKAIDDNANAEKKEAENAVYLKGKLYELESQIKSGTLTDAEATQKKNEFSNAASELEELIPGVTSALYNETGEIDIQKQAIDALVSSYYDLAVAKAMASAYEKKFQQDAEDLIDAKETLDTAKKNYKDALSERDNPEQTNNSVVGGLGIAPHAAVGNTKKAYDEAKKSFDEIEKRREKNFENFQKYSIEAQGLVKKYTDAGGKVVEDSEKNKVNAVRTGTREQTDERMEQYRKENKFLKHARNMDEITEEDYYGELEKLRDEYLSEGSDEWLSATEEIYRYQKDFLENQKKLYKDTYDDIFEYTSGKIDAVIKKQEAYSQKLKSYGSLFNKVTIHLDDEPDIEYYKLADLKKDTEALKQYNELMTSAKEKVLKSGMSENSVNSFLGELNNFGIGEGTSMLKAMLSANDNDFSEYLKAYDEKHTFADSAGASFYADEMDAALDESVKYMKEKLIEAGFEIPETFFTAGSDAAIKFGEAFNSEIDIELNKIKAKIEGFKAKIVVDVEINENLKGTQTVINNNDNRVTNISASYSSQRAFLESKRELENYQNHTAKLE